MSARGSLPDRRRARRLALRHRRAPLTKVKEVEALWHEILSDDDFMLRPRMSRIYYNGKYYDYPLKASNALKNLGIWEAFPCVMSYVQVHQSAEGQDDARGLDRPARFGWRLYKHFFRTSPREALGRSRELNACSPTSAAQRIKNLSLSNAIMNALLPKRNQKGITSLIEEFQYPKYGPGMMWEKCRDLVEARGCTVTMNTRVAAIRHENGRAVSVIAQGKDGTRTEYPCDHVISPADLSRDSAMDPAPSESGVQGGGRFALPGLHHRGPGRAGSLQLPRQLDLCPLEGGAGRADPEPGSWLHLPQKEGRTCLGLEFFVFEGDATWTKPDAELIEQGKRELGILGLVDPAKVEAGYVVRMPKAYPFYDEYYKANVARIVEWLTKCTPNVHPIGRNGMHRYNNQDHSMYTAMLTAENIALGSHHDVWSVNVEDVYHEESKNRKDDSRRGPRGTGRDAPVISRQHYGPDHPVNQPAGKP